MAVMSSAEPVKKALNIAHNYDTVYDWGPFGWLWNQAALDRVAAQYPNFYTMTKRAELR